MPATRAGTLATEPRSPREQPTWSRRPLGAWPLQARLFLGLTPGPLLSVVVSTRPCGRGEGRALSGTGDGGGQPASPASYTGRHRHKVRPQFYLLIYKYCCVYRHLVFVNTIISKPSNTILNTL